LIFDDVAIPEPLPPGAMIEVAQAGRPEHNGRRRAELELAQMANVEALLRRED
jgi:hypothetical protein